MSDERTLRRRAYLALIGSSAALAGCGGRPGPSPTTTPSPAGTTGTGTPGQTGAGTTTKRSPTPDHYGFSRVIDAVADLGCDPSGNEPCDARLQAAVGTDTLFSFPAGSYRFAHNLEVHDIDTIGFTGRGDVRFIPPEGFDDKLLNVSNLGDVVFTGIDLDLGAPDTTAGLRFIVDRTFRVEDVEFIGRGNHPNPEVPFALFLAVKNAGTVGVVRNVVAKHGSAIGEYKGGNGRGGIWIGPQHRGTIRVLDCHFEEFGNNGMYASRNPGRVQVVGGLFRNNNVSQIRISGKGSYVQGATIIIDLRRYTGPRTSMNSSFNTRGVMIEQGPFNKPAGVEVRDCDIRLLDTSLSKGGIVVEPTGRTVTVRNTHIQVDVDDTPAVHRVLLGQQGRNSPSKPPHWVYLDGVTVTGTAAGGSSVLLVDAPNSVLRDCQIEPQGANRDGIQLFRSPGVSIEGGTLSTSRYPILVGLDGADASLDELCIGPDVAVQTGFKGPVKRLTAVDKATDTRVGRCYNVADIVGQVDPSMELAITKVNGDDLYGAFVPVETTTAGG